MSVNPFGPMSAAEFQEAVDAPYGRAGDILRKRDPLWGRNFPDGPVVRWKVVLHQRVTMAAVKYVEAASEEEAEAMVGAMDTSALVFDKFVDAGDEEVISVEEVP